MRTAASKYHNRKVTLDGLSFDSVAEAGRYGELRLRWLAGEIINLEVHPRLLLVPAFVRVVEGKRRTSRPRHYIADFSYQIRDSYRVIEDVKGGKATQTALWSLKWALAQYVYPEWEFRVIAR